MTKKSGSLKQTHAFLFSLRVIVIPKNAEKHYQILTLNLSTYRFDRTSCSISAFIYEDLNFSIYLATASTFDPDRHLSRLDRNFTQQNVGGEFVQQ